MWSLVTTAVSAFVVTFLTVMVPSPSTVTASRYVMRDGLRAGVAFLGGVLFLEIAVYLVLAHGFHPALNALGAARYVMPLAGAGLIVFGCIMIVTARRGGFFRRSMMEGQDAKSSTTAHRPFVAGILVPAANPGFWIWWTTVGTSFIHSARRWGGLGLGVLLLAFLGGATAWYVPLLWALSRGRQIFSDRAQVRLLVVLGVVMSGFGAVLLWRSIAALGS